MNAGLPEPYRVFAAFHALGHWILHPGEADYYLGSPGWFAKTEVEASTVGFLAIAPYAGPPYPVVEKAYGEEERMLFWVKYPERGSDGKIRWRGRQTVLFRRTEQLDFKGGTA